MWVVIVQHGCVVHLCGAPLRCTFLQGNPSNPVAPPVLHSAQLVMLCPAFRFTMGLVQQQQRTAADQSATIL